MSLRQIDKVTVLIGNILDHVLNGLHLLEPVFLKTKEVLELVSEHVRIDLRMEGRITSFAKYPAVVQLLYAQVVYPHNFLQCLDRR